MPFVGQSEISLSEKLLINQCFTSFSGMQMPEIEYESSVFCCAAF